MRSNFLDRARKSLGFRLAGWYFTVFVLSSVTLAMISYGFLSASLRDNRKAIQAKLLALMTVAKTAGVDGVKEAAQVRGRASRRTAYFVRVIGSNNHEIFRNAPRLWERFDIEAFPDRPAEGAWQYIPSKADGDLLEVTAGRLPDGYLLQVGRTVEAREDILEDYRNTIAAVAIPMVLIALVGGAIFGFRAVRPIRHLIATTQSIVDTGRMDVRVPEGRTGSELDELVKLFNRMLGRIEDLIRGIREALDNVAHDLRTPMARLRGIAEASLQSQTAAQHEDALASCVEESDRIIKLLDSLMDISEAETGTMRLRLETVAVLDLLEQVVELYQYVAEEKAVTVSIACPQDLVVSADRSRLRQALANLLDNAIKYNAPGGTVLITARREQQEIIIGIKDNGAGIPSDEIPKIWERLHRGDKSRSEPGLGLGLSLVRAIVHAHEGHIEVESQLGAGSVFTLGLPAGRAHN